MPGFGSTSGWCNWATELSLDWANMGHCDPKCLHCSGQCASEISRDPDYIPQPGDIWIVGDCADPTQHHAGLVLGHWHLSGETGVWTIDGNVEIDPKTCRIVRGSRSEGVGYRSRWVWSDYDNAAGATVPGDPGKRCYINVGECLDIANEVLG